MDSSLGRTISRLFLFASAHTVFFVFPHGADYQRDTNPTFPAKIKRTNKVHCGSLRSRPERQKKTNKQNIKNPTQEETRAVRFVRKKKNITTEIFHFVFFKIENRRNRRIILISSGRAGSSSSPCLSLSLSLSPSCSLLSLSFSCCRFFFLLLPLVILFRRLRRHFTCATALPTCRANLPPVAAGCASFKPPLIYSLRFSFLSRSLSLSLSLSRPPK